MRWGRLSFAAAVFVVAATIVAFSQGVVLPCYFVTTVQCQVVSVANPLPTTGGGGGGGGAVTIADGADVAQGATADAAATAGSTGTLSAKLRLMTTQLASVITNTSAVSSAVNVTPTNCSGTIAAGGTAQNAFTAGATKHGFTIMNLSTEDMWVSFTTTAAADTVASYLLNPSSTGVAGGSYSTPSGFGMNTALSVVGATTGNKFSCTWW